MFIETRIIRLMKKGTGVKKSRWTVPWMCFIRKLQNISDEYHCVLQKKRTCPSFSIEMSEVWYQALSEILYHEYQSERLPLVYSRNDTFFYFFAKVSTIFGLVWSLRHLLQRLQILYICHFWQLCQICVIFFAHVSIIYFVKPTWNTNICLLKKFIGCLKN